MKPLLTSRTIVNNKPQSTNLITVTSGAQYASQYHNLSRYYSAVAGPQHAAYRIYLGAMN